MWLSIEARRAVARGSQSGRKVTSPVRITGPTRLYAILGDPIVQVRSPEVYTERFAAIHMNAVLVPALVPAKRFDEVIPALMALGNLDGLLVARARQIFIRRSGQSSAAGRKRSGRIYMN